ncbi:MAG: hypothetical protein FWG64_14175 [Firmicutes bacterium]|nr:hypothetical protein [Bacillota bacterium]
MPINNFDSWCDKNQPIIVSQDGGKNSPKHTAINAAEPPAYVTQYKIDGVILKNETCCDFLVINEETRIAYLIELKGHGIEKAVDQLESTEKKLSKQLENYDLRFRIIAKRFPKPARETTKFKKFCHNRKNKVIHRSGGYLEEEI